MTRIAPIQIAAILADVSWMDRLDLTSPSANERNRAALIIAETIVSRLAEPAMTSDPDQLTLPIA